MLKRLRIAVLALVALVALLAVAVAANTWRQGSRQIAVPALAVLAVDSAAAGDSLAMAVRAQTLSSQTDPQASAPAFEALQAHLKARYPLVHGRLTLERVGGRSLLYHWPGSDAQAPGIALMAHQDVVPVSPGTEGDWTHPPFDGVVKDGFVWGRGAWDDKGNLIAQLEAIEMLLASGMQPRRSIYLAYGADEEVGGEGGAALIAALLKQRGVRLEFVIDEGLLITEGLMPGLKPPAALVGVAEKGYLSVRLGTEGTPGHSSMPPPPGSSAIARLSAALQRLDRQPLPGGVKDGVVREMFDAVAPEMSGLNHYVLTNLWLFEPVVTRMLQGTPSINALMRTTTALTIVQAGNKDNVLPGRAEAVVNLRLLPGDSQASVLAQLRQIINDDGVTLQVLPGSSEPSPVSSTASPSYRLIETTVRELFPGTVVAPGLMIGATDSRHFAAVADQVFRFSPVRARPEDLARFHGVNERISLDNLAELIRFYHRLVQQAAL